MKRKNKALILITLILAILLSFAMTADAYIYDFTEINVLDDLPEIVLNEIFITDGIIKLVSPDGKTVVVYDSNNGNEIIKFYDLETNKSLYDINSTYFSGAFYPDSSKVIIECGSNQYYSAEYLLIDTNTIQVIKSPIIEGKIIAITKDGQNLITLGGKNNNGSLNIYDASTFELKSSANFDGLSMFLDASYNPVNNQIAVAGFGQFNYIKICDLNGKVITTKTKGLTGINAIESVYYYANYVLLHVSGNNFYLFDLTNDNDKLLSSFSIPIAFPALYDDVFLSGDVTVDVKNKNTISNALYNSTSYDHFYAEIEYISQILPEVKYGVSKYKIYDLSPLFRRVTDIYIDTWYPINETRKLSSWEINIAFSDNTYESVTADKLNISTSNARILSISGGSITGNDIGTVNLTAKYGGFEKTVQVQVMAIPSNIAASIKTNLIELTWAKPTYGADKISGYYIYRTTEKGKYSNIPLQDIPIKSDVYSYTDQNTEKNVQYYYMYRLVHNDGTLSPPSNEVAVMISTNTTVAMQINNANMVTDGDKYVEVDPGRGTKPIIKNDRTIVPISAIIQAFGGTVGWNGTERKVTITLNENTVELWIGQKRAVVNGEEKILDVVPEIINDRTFVPVRFVSENLNLNVQWEANNNLIVISEKPIGNVLDCPEVKRLLK